MKLLLSILLLAIVMYVPSHATASPNTRLNLKLLAIDCLFEIVNDGSNQIIYLTPEQCGQLIEIPPVSRDEPSIIDQSNEPTVIFGPLFGPDPNEDNTSQPEANRPTENQIDNTSADGNLAPIPQQDSSPWLLISLAGLAVFAFTSSWWLGLIKYKRLRTKVLDWLTRFKRKD